MIIVGARVEVCVRIEAIIIFGEESRLRLGWIMIEVMIIVW